ncbi:MAG TPA: deoxyribonuclease IV [Trebonia sp.]|nr:deoxyribonuclease IV [Trebonia sp.]
MGLIGSHATVTGGLATGALAYAAEVGAEVIQVFVSNPRGWAAGPGKPGEDARLRDSGIPVFIHATYMVNLGSGNPDVAAKSADAVAHALRRGAEIGARGVVVHAGSAVGWDRDRALRQLGELTLPLLDKLGDDDPDLLFEPMAGQGQMLCTRAGDLAEYLDALEGHPKAGVCLDTCHVFAAGHDLTADGGVAAMLAEAGLADGGAGPGRVRLVHANDSLLGCGSRRDRHETIGAGLIGTGPFRELLAHPALAGTPFVVETPGGKTGHARDIATLKGLRAGRPAADTARKTASDTAGDTAGETGSAGDAGRGPGRRPRGRR